MKLINKLAIQLIALAFVPAALCAAEKIENKVVAKVNNKVILLSEFNNRAEPIIAEYEKLYTGEDKKEKIKELKDNIINQMIDEKLLVQKADEDNISVTDTEIDQGMEEIRARFPSEVEFQNEISKQGLSDKSFRDNVKDQLRVIKLINQNVQSKVAPPTDAEIKEYYDAHIDEMVTPEQVRARHILIKTSEEKSQEAAKKEADKIYEEVKKDPTKFSQLAEKYSEGPTASSGGDLGYFSKGDMVKEFEDVAFSMQVGEISKPVKTRFGYHIIKIVGKNLSEKKSYEEVKDRLKNLLYQMNMESEYEKLLRELRDQAKISKSLPEND